MRDETVIWVKDNSGLQGVRIDLADFPRVQSFPGTWALPPGKGAKRYVQGKWRHPETVRPQTVYLHRWIVEAGEDSIVHPGGDPLDCRRQNLEVSLKRRSYIRQIGRRKSETERLAYTRALARKLAESSPPYSPAQLLRALQRGRLAEYGPDVEEAAARLTSERTASLPRLPIRTRWESRLPEILHALASAPCDFISRRQIEILFDVSRMTAMKILDRFGARRAGPA
jgi:hypothetical protein